MGSYRSSVAANAYRKPSCHRSILSRVTLLALIWATVGALQPVFAQGNPVDTLIQGAISIGKSKQAASDWQQVSPPVQSCINRVLQPRNTSIQNLIQQGVGPADHRLSQLKANCEQVLSRPLQENVDCQLQLPSGGSVTSKCDEAWSLRQARGTAQKISRDEAIAAMASNQQIAITRFERPDALSRRQEVDRKTAALAAEQAAKLDAQRREDERRMRAQRQEEERRREEFQMAEARRKQEEFNRQLEIARLEAERAKALQEAARIKAMAEAQRAAEEARKEQEAKEAELKRVAEEKERSRVAQVSALAAKVEDERRGCVPATEPAGYFSSLFGKSAALKRAADQSLPLSDALSAITTFVVDGKDNEATAALALRIVEQSHKWNALSAEFIEQRRDFASAMLILQKNCLFDAIDYLGAKNANLMKSEVSATLGYGNSSLNADLVSVLRIVAPSALQRAHDGNGVTPARFFAAAEKQLADRRPPVEGSQEGNSSANLPYPSYPRGVDGVYGRVSYKGSPTTVGKGDAKYRVSKGHIYYALDRTDSLQIKACGTPTKVPGDQTEWCELFEFKPGEKVLLSPGSTGSWDDFCVTSEANICLSDTSVSTLTGWACIQGMADTFASNDPIALSSKSTVCFHNIEKRMLLKFSSTTWISVKEVRQSASPAVRCTRHYDPSGRYCIQDRSALGEKQSDQSSTEWIGVR